MKHTKQNEFPNDFWNYNIHPILGYYWKRPKLSEQYTRQNKLEYNEDMQE